MDCIILDIDGTLWDSTPIVADAWNIVLNERTDVAWRATPEKLKQLFGRPLPVIASMIFTELPEEEQKNKIKNIYHNIQNNIQIFHNTENLNKQINAIYKDFLDRLDTKYPGLTKADKKLCTMLYINMSSKDIAAMTNTTVRTVETSRYRLRRKFNLTRDEDIVNFLQKI